MTFRLTTLLWAFAVVAASLAVFGVFGILLAAYIFWLWACILYRVWPGWQTLWCVLLLSILVALAIPAIEPSRVPSRRNLSLNDTKQLILALLNYESANGHFPPPCVTDEEGNKLYSWRAEILPHISGNTVQGKFRYDEPWDSAANAKLLANVEEFRCPRISRNESLPGETHYLAIVDDETAWTPEGKTSLRDITDGASNTVLLLEVGGWDIQWSEPRDLTMDEAIDVLTGKNSPDQYTIVPGYFASEKYKLDGLSYRCVGFADGHAEAIAPLKSREQARALLTRAGGEELPEYLDEIDQPYNRIHVATIIHWGRVWGLVLWGSLILLPAFPAARRKLFPRLRNEQEPPIDADER